MNQRAVGKAIVLLVIFAFLLGACGQAEEDARFTPSPSISTPSTDGPLDPAPTPTDEPAETVEPAPTVEPDATGQPSPADDRPAPDRPGDPAMGRAYITSLSLSVMESFPVQVRAHISGELSDACTQLAGVDVRRDGRIFQIQVRTTRDPEAICAQVLAPFETSVDLETRGLAAGTYTVTAGDLSDSFNLAVDNTAQAGGRFTTHVQVPGDAGIDPARVFMAVSAF